jgi:hypothetical protein
VRFLNRLFAVVLSLVLIGANAAVCAGWSPAPEARMACCAKTDECPMHGSGSHDVARGHSHTQAQADACCAASERHSTRTIPALTAAISSAVLGTGIVMPTCAPAIVSSDGWRTDTPVPSASVPRHLLLSVFLV